MLQGVLNAWQSSPEVVYRCQGELVLQNVLQKLMQGHELLFVTGLVGKVKEKPVLQLGLRTLEDSSLCLLIEAKVKMAAGQECPYFL